jgi:hypothetical protein
MSLFLGIKQDIFFCNVANAFATLQKKGRSQGNSPESGLKKLSYIECGASAAYLVTRLL